MLICALSEAGHGTCPLNLHAEHAESCPCRSSVNCRFPETRFGSRVADANALRAAFMEDRRLPEAQRRYRADAVPNQDDEDDAPEIDVDGSGGETVPVAWDCDIETYHADGMNSVSHSELDVFIEKPSRYRGRFITGAIPRKTSKTLDFGNATHEEILKAELIEKRIVIIPEGVLSADGRRIGKAWQAFRDAHPGKLLMKTEDLDTIRAMEAEIKRHPAASILLDEQGINERGIKWRDESTGLWLRARPDKLRLTGRMPCIVDLKTCRSADPEEFRRDAWNLGYHRQAAFYREAVYQLTGRWLPFVFVAVEKELPHTVEAIAMSDSLVSRGATENRLALERLAACRLSGNWERPGYGEIVEIDAPAFAPKFEGAI